SICQYISQFFFHLLRIRRFRRFPEECLKELARLDTKRHSEILRVVELLPISLVTKLSQLLYQLIHLQPFLEVRFPRYCGISPVFSVSRIHSSNSPGGSGRENKYPCTTG